MRPEQSGILVVEDSPTMRKLYRLVLEGDEACLRFARDGVEGLDLAAQHPDVSLFIVDINMPRMDGLEFVRRLRQELGRTEASVLVISTEAEDDDRRAALEAGADGYLCKPLEPEVLRREVARLGGGRADD